MSNLQIQVQESDFDVGALYQEMLTNNTADGAVVLFIGRVREFNQGSNVSGLELEHYPAMTNKVLHEISRQAQQKWDLGPIRITHRIGKLTLSEQIVFVGVCSPHREDAFSAAQFIMDFLKTEAPFWKKETNTSGTENWVEHESKNTDARKKWE